jgi:tetratricopeptide (TPR) repeat protein
VRQQTIHHRIYGDIPLVERRSVYKGKELVWTEPDRTYQPPMPNGAVRGNPLAQHYCHDFPKYFYLDEPRTCVQCGRSFVFYAKEQRFWYEVLHFNFGSTAIRCLDCRKRHRTEHSLREQIGTVLKGLETRRDDPDLCLDLARATVQYREMTGEGNLDRAIAAARKAGSQWRDAAEPLYWEGKAQYLAGRMTKAQQCFEQFLGKAPSGRRISELVRDAKNLLTATGRGTAPAPSGTRSRRGSSR